jgi:hypothetical protein
MVSLQTIGTFDLWSPPPGDKDWEADGFQILNIRRKLSLCLAVEVPPKKGVPENSFLAALRRRGTWGPVTISLFPFMSLRTHREVNEGERESWLQVLEGDNAPGSIIDYSNNRSLDVIITFCVTVTIDTRPSGPDTPWASTRCLLGLQAASRERRCVTSWPVPPQLYGYSP